MADKLAKDVTHAQLTTLINNSDLRTGEKLILTFNTVHYLTDGLSSHVLMGDAPALASATITPDAVGTNPVNYYYRLIGTKAAGEDTVRTIAADEIVTEEGDSTTEVILACETLNGCEYVDVFRGTVTGVYTDAVHILTNAVDPFTYDIFETLIPIGEGLGYDDYLLYNIFQVSDESGDPVSVTGTTETLILTATSPNTIDKQVQSIEYPNDIIEYDWNPANWMDNINFVTGETPTLITGFKGVITYREDTIKNLSCGFDFRNCKTRLWDLDVSDLDFVCTILFSSDSRGIVHNDDVIVPTLAEKTYKDVLTFGGANIRDSHIAKGLYTNIPIVPRLYALIPNVVFENDIENGETYNITIGKNYNVYCTGYCQSISILDGGKNIYLDESQNATIGVECNMLIANNNVSSFSIENCTETNIIGSDSGFFTIGSGCENLNIPPESLMFAVSEGISTVVDLSEVTELADEYSKTIQLNNDGNVILVYFDSATGQTIVNLSNPA